MFLGDSELLFRISAKNFSGKLESITWFEKYITIALARNCIKQETESRPPNSIALFTTSWIAHRSVSKFIKFSMKRNTTPCNRKTWPNIFFIFIFNDIF